MHLTLEQLADLAAIADVLGPLAAAAVFGTVQAVRTWRKRREARREK